MAVLVKWRSSDNVDTAWTSINTDGGAISYTGSPLKKMFDMTGRATTNFNVLGHYYTGGTAAAADYRWICWAAVSSVATTDCVPFGIQTTDTINSLTDFYVTESSVLTPDGAAAGTCVAGTYHKYELVIEAGGTLAVYFDDAAITTGEAGNAWHTRTIRGACNVARIGGATGNLKWQEFYVTDANGLTPPVVTTLAAAQNGQTAINLTWSDATASSTNTDSIRIERSTSSGSGFSEIGTAAIGDQAYADSGLSPGTTYYYRLRTRFVTNSVNNHSAYTSEANATTVAPTKRGSLIMRSTSQGKY